MIFRINQNLMLSPGDNIGIFENINLDTNTSFPFVMTNVVGGSVFNYVANRIYGAGTVSITNFFDRLSFIPLFSTKV
ncbi:hypothetical protein [Solitalea longa]|nr:hypothetical protein [Solitalea longa]